MRDAAIVYEFKYLRSVGYRTVLVEITDNLEDSSKVFLTGRNCAPGCKEEITRDSVVRILSNVQCG